MKNYRAGWKTGTPLASDFLCNDAEKLLIAMGGGAAQDLIVKLPTVSPVFGDFSPGTGFFRALLRTGMKRSDKLCVLERVA